VFYFYASPLGGQLSGEEEKQKLRPSGYIIGLTACGGKKKRVLKHWAPGMTRKVTG